MIKSILYKMGVLNEKRCKRKYMILDSQKETIQNNMEARALNIILRSIIGDKNFSYQAIEKSK
jgi:hypothetical protein